MATKSFKVPKMGRHKATGQARVVVDGKHVYLGEYGSEKAKDAYKRLLHELTAKAVGIVTPAGSVLAPVVAPSLPTVSEVADRFVTWAESYYVKCGRQTGEVGALVRPVRVLRETYGSLPAAEFTIEHLEVLREALVNTPRCAAAPGKPPPENLCRRTVNSHVARIKSIFRWAAEKRLIKPEVYFGIKMMRELGPGRTKAREMPRVQPVPRKCVDAVFPFLSRQAAALVEFLWWTGARPNEGCMLRHGDIDRSGPIWIYKVRTEANKNAHHGQPRFVLIGPRGQKILKPFLSRVPKPDAEAFVFSPAEAEAERYAARSRERQAPPWPSHDPEHRRDLRGRPRQLRDHYTPDVLRRAVERACTTAKVVPSWNPGQLRHSCATRIRAERGGLDAVTTVLGHSDESMAKVYADPDMQRAVEIMKKLG